MNRTELVETIASQCELSKAKAAKVVSTFVWTISKTMCDGDPVRITGFGTFRPRARRSAVRVNPQTGERITVPARAVATFRAGSDLSELVRKKLKVVESGGGEVSLVKAVG